MTGAGAPEPTPMLKSAAMRDSRLREGVVGHQPGGKIAVASLEGGKDVVVILVPAVRDAGAAEDADDQRGAA